MLKATVNLLRRRFPKLAELALRARWKRRVEGLIKSGEFDPTPSKVAYFDDYERSDATRKIPRLFHQTWRDENIPPFLRSSREETIRLHPAPTWQHHLWTDDEIYPFVRDTFPHYWKAFQLLPKNIMRIDIFRYMLLWDRGGVYVDLDFLMHRPIDDLISDCTLVLPAESENVGSESFCGQHFLASCPKHALWEDCLKACLERPESEILSQLDPITVTGPEFVTRIWRANKEKYRAKIPMRVYLAPPTGYMYSGMPLPALSYGIHECHGTWR